MKTTMLLLFVCIVVSLAAEATINVTYTGFTAEQQAAFEAGVSLWEPILESTIPIKIHAVFAPLTGFSLVTVPNMIRNFAGAPLTNVWYPTSLANAMTNSELNPGEADVDFFINSNDPFYWGLDGNCPITSLDFVTEILKSVPYGLGYMTSFYIQTGYGSYGMLNPSVLGLTTSFPWEAMQNQPAIYDTFVKNTSDQSLTDTAIFTNPSPGLATQLTGGNLRYTGEQGIVYNMNELPVLYASTFNLARTARLNTATYLGTENASGCPYGTYGDVFRLPSPIVLGMLIDMGWELDLSSLRTPPAELTAEVQNGNVHLAWNAPVTDYVIHNYLVFKDDALLSPADDLTYIDSAVPSGTYVYTVRARYSMGISAYSNPVTVEVTTANDDDTIIPGNNLALQIAPNPIRTSAQISYKLSSAQNVNLSVYDVKGKEVLHQNLGTSQPGTHTAALNHLSENQAVTNGIYFVKVQAGNQSAVSKVLVIK